MRYCYKIKSGENIIAADDNLTYRAKYKVAITDNDTVNTIRNVNAEIIVAKDSGTNNLSFYKILYWVGQTAYLSGNFYPSNGETFYNIDNTKMIVEVNTVITIKEKANNQ